jgi:hypothetical protein
MVFFDEDGAPAHITISSTVEDTVEPIEKAPQQAGARFLGFEQKSGECGTERQRVERGKKHGNRDGDGELLIEFAGDSGNEGGGHENGRKNQSDADDGSGQFFHGLQSGVFRSHAFFDVALDAFHNDDGVVDDQADGQDQAEERGC